MDETFVCKGVRYGVRRPLPQDVAAGDRVYRKALEAAAAAGAPCGRSIPDLLKERGLWDEPKYRDLARLTDEVLKGREALAGGRLRKAEALSLARQVRRKCAVIRDLMADWRSVEQETAEAQAQNARFDFLVTRCFVLADGGRPVFASVEDYKRHAGERHAYRGAEALARLLVPDFINVEDAVVGLTN